MRVLLIASFAESIPAFRGHLIKALTESGAEVHVAAPEIGTSSQVQTIVKRLGVVPHNIPLRRTGANPLHDIVLLVSLIRLFAKVRPDVALPYTVKPIVYGALAGWFMRVPHRYALVTGLGYAFTGSRGGLLSGMVRRLYRVALGRVDKVFFQNRDDRALFLNAGIVSPHKPTVVVNGSGVDVSAFEESPIPEGATIFLMIGRLLGDKGLREYAEAAARMRAMHPNACFRLVGWIDENPDAIAQAELDQWVASGDIEFHGKLVDVRPSIAASTVYVLPSYREGTPRTVLEAMAMGRPIITTDAPGCRETVIDGDNGFLVPVQSVDALVEAMLKFIEDPTLAQRMGRRSRQIAEDRYDVHKVNAVMLREMGIPVAPKASTGGV